MPKQQKRIRQAVKFVKKQIQEKPAIAIVLGSGLGALAETTEEGIAIPYQQIPDFPVSTVPGHAGRLVVGRLAGRSVIMMQGRFHCYEGYSAQEVAFPIWVMSALGAHTLIVTNAAGAVNKDFRPGDLMLITDHINLLGQNPLIGSNLDRFGPRFPDMSTAYSPHLQRLARNNAQSLSFNLREGVYACGSGPSYETPAEIRMLRTLGADAVGMSTVPEVIAAVHSGMSVVGVSCISNMAAGILEQPLNHEEVIETSSQVRELFIRFLLKLVEGIP